MKMKRIVLPILILTFFGCGERFDKLKKTEEIVKEFSSKKGEIFFVEASIDEDNSELKITLEHELFQAYYTAALYEIIRDLHKNNIKYDHYSIKPTNGDIVWSIDDTEISEVTKTLKHSRRLMKLLNNRNYDEFLSYSNFKILGISDSAFLAAVEQNPVYPNTEYKGFSIMQKEINGEKRKFMYVFFMNNERKQNMLVLDPKDQLVYGLEY